MNFRTRRFLALGTFVLVSLLGSAQAANSYKILHTFNNQHGDGYQPVGALIFDSSGNLYGTTAGGGTGCTGGCGTVFELKPNQGGSWSESILHEFTLADGAYPYAPLTFDHHGNLLGTTGNGGTDDAGTVFELVAGANGAWRSLTLQSFTGGLDGGFPHSGVLVDDAGRIYGTTSGGGGTDGGVVFTLGGGPRLGSTVIHDFTSGSDGMLAFGTLVSDANGNLYGTTWAGGTYGAGTVFKMTRDPLSGDWSETIVYSFQGVPYGGGDDGAEPYAGVSFDAEGNLYGTTCYGGSATLGVVFQLTPNSDGTWSETLLHVFTGQDDGGVPYGGISLDQSGNLYGTTNVGGGGHWGTVFKLTKLPSGQWSETVLHAFNGADGGNPGDGVILDSSGNVYGTAAVSGGGVFGGVVFEITP
jgi:uncharacterized repeat protein (TIGR03803 family)